MRKCLQCEIEYQNDNTTTCLYCGCSTEEVKKTVKKKKEKTGIAGIVEADE